MPLEELAPGAGVDGTQTPTIDIVAVHGLNPKGKDNHATDTWTKKSGGSNRNWLRDDLPRDMPDVRVLLYEYDSFPVLTSTKTRFVHQASDLLYCLDMERDTCPDRPLIFVAHSLGGILVKQALVNANNDPSYARIKDSTRGLAFFGTPHAGGSDTLVSFGRKCAAIVNTVTRSAPNDLMEAVSSGSLYTDILQETWRHQLNDYRIISFYEGLGNVVPRESAVFNMPGGVETQVRIDANHSDMCRFDTSVKADLGSYHKVRHGIRVLHRAALNPTLPTPPSTIPTQPSVPPFPSIDFSREDSIRHNPKPTQEPRRRGSAKSDVDISIPAAIDALAVVRSVFERHGTQHNIPSIPTPSELSEQSWVLPTFLRSFIHYNYEGNFEEISQARNPRTCDWILETDEISCWASRQESSLLWFTGHPGIGKSTLAGYLARELRNPREALDIGLKSTVVYSFCDYEENYTASMVISTIIHQMLRQFPSLQSFAYQADRWECLGTSQGRIMKGKHRSSSIIWHLFRQLVNNSGLEKIFLIIDALDVCKEPEQDILLRLFALTFEPPRHSKTALKIFISSRPGDHIAIIQSKWATRYPETFSHIEATQYETLINQDIDNFVQREAARVQKLRGYSLKEMELIKKQLSTSEYKSFLPVTLYFKNLETTPPSKLAEVLDGVSKDLRVFYQTLVSQLPPRLQYSPSRPMTFITYSFRSLKLTELALACWWDEKASSGAAELRAELENPLDDEYTSKAKAIVKMYYPLLKIGKDGSVSFFHDSIREFIIQDVGCRDDFFVGNAKKAHRDLALICIRTIIAKSTIPYSETWSKDYKRLRLLHEKHVLLSYAMQFWHKHIQEAVPSDTQVDEIDDEILLAVKDLVDIWRRGTSVSYQRTLLSYLGIDLDKAYFLRTLTPLEVLSALGLDPFLRAFLKLPDVERSFNIMIPDAENAINLAIKGGHEGALAILLAAFNITSLEGENFKTIVADSAWSGQAGMVQRVLDLRKSRSQELRAALVAAFMRGDHESLDHLARDRSIFQNRDHFGMTALHAVFAYRGYGGQRDTEATRTVYFAIVEYLVSHGVGINSRDNYGFTPLHWACANPFFCETSVIDFLVSRGADPRIQSITGLTSLHYSAYYARDIEPIKRLLELGGINLLGMASAGRMTPLHWAVSRPARRDNDGFDTTGPVIEYFLRNGADIRAPNLRGLTPVEWCSHYRLYELQTIYTSLQGIDTIAITHHTDMRAFILWEGWTGVTPQALSQIAQVLSQDELVNGAELGSIESQFLLSSGHIYVKQLSGSDTPRKETQNLEAHPILLSKRVPRRLREAWREIWTRKPGR